MAYFGAPVTGLDGSGNSIMMLLGPDNLIEASGNSSSFNQPADWQSVSVDALFSNDSGGIIGFGSGVNAAGTRVPLNWIKSGSSWTISTSYNLQGVKRVGAVYDTKWQVAVGSSIKTVDSLNASNIGLSADVTISTLSPHAADVLDYNGAIMVSASLDSLGTRTNTTDWKLHIGPYIEFKSSTLGTVYAFPGYTSVDGVLEPKVQAALLPNGQDGSGLVNGVVSATRSV